MKPTLLLLSMVLVFQSCGKKVTYTPISNYKPILMPQAELANSVSFEGNSEIGKVCQILTYGKYLFILEIYKGIHYFDNTVPSAPVAIGFIRIPGCTAIATKDNILLADNGTDLISIDFTNKTVVGRNANALGQLLSPDFVQPYSIYNQSGWPKGSVIVAWERVKN